MEKNPQPDTDTGEEEAEEQKDVESAVEMEVDVADTSDGIEEDTITQADAQSVLPTFTIADDAPDPPELQTELSETFKQLCSAIASNKQREHQHSQFLRRTIDERRLIIANLHQ